ncbi:MAG: YidC/Oxa1 family membrane protein insertase, partial [Clostridia bacterium]|nr:YidC/Oxa1 family membrane protein insertase [Clostridia bacterium]
MSNILRPILDAIYGVVANYGWSVVIFTILIRLVLMPLDIKNRKGMLKMQKMQPKIDALQKKYANDQQKLQQKQMELFKKENYNPMSGCLPMLITLPVFWIMFEAMRTMANEQLIQQVLTYIAGDTPELAGWFWIKNLWVTDSPFAATVPTLNSLTAIVNRDTWIKVISSLSPDQLNAIIANIPDYTEGLLAVTSDTNLQALATTLYNAATLQPAYQAALTTTISNLNVLFLFNVNVYANYNGLLILPILSAVTQIVMNRTMQTTGSSAKKEGAQQSQAESMNKFMKYFFPILSVYFCLVSSASFALYWVTSNIVAGIQNYAINKYFENKDKQSD